MGWGAVGSNGGDHLLLAQFRDGDFVGSLPGQQAEGRVELVGAEAAEDVGGDTLAEADLDSRGELG